MAVERDERTYKLVSIEKVPPPDPKGKGTWYRYVIGNELTSIEGYARGSRITVTSTTARLVEAYNAKNDPSVSVGPWATQRRKTAVAGNK